MLVASPGWDHDKTETRLAESRPVSVSLQKALCAFNARAVLANTLGSPVVDKTGLYGLYDYTVEWPDAGSSLFASLDQPGLKLEAKKEPVDVLVMERGEHPSAN